MMNSRKSMISRQFSLRISSSRSLLVTACVFGVISALSQLSNPVSAQSYLEDTVLLDLRMGSFRSEIAAGLAIGGYELADGTPIRFEEWYRPNFPDMNIRFLTEINPSLGLVWGLSIGESGEKYRIDPGLWLGIVYRAEISRNSSLTFSVATMIGGNFREHACIGDYGEIGGIQAVNCRLAASILPPAETLQFLVNVPGSRETRISIRYELRF